MWLGCGDSLLLGFGAQRCWAWLLMFVTGLGWMHFAVFGC